MAGVGLEYAILLRRRQAREQRQDFHHAGTMPPDRMLAQVLGRLADLPLSGQEHQRVARTVRVVQIVQRVGDRLAEIGCFALLVGFQRAVLDLHRVQPPRHLHHRRVEEVLREAFGVDGGRRDDELEVRPARQQLAQIAQQEVDVEAALVRLVDDHRVVGAQLRGRSASRRAGCRRSSASPRRRAAAGLESAPCSPPPRRAASPARRRCAWPRSRRRCGAAGCGRSSRCRRRRGRARARARSSAAAWSCPSRSRRRRSRPGARGSLERSRRAAR